MQSKFLSNLREIWTFFGGFVRHPFATGAVLPSSRSLAEALLRLGNIAPGSVVVEFGPGTGSCTTHLLRRVGARGKVIGFDTNVQFVEMLRKRFPDGVFIHDGAQNAHAHLQRMGIRQVDAIVCGLPFATIPPEVQRKIIEASDRILRTDGTFMSFQYFLTMAWPRTRLFKSMLAETFDHLTSKPVWLNVPPAVIVRAQKNGTAA